MPDSDGRKMAFVRRFEDMIISGRFAIGERLPSERELAELAGLSRSVVREGLAELASIGLVTLRPRSGTLVNDYRREGSLAILNSILRHREGGFGAGMVDSLLAMRMLFMVECASLAARRRTASQLEELRSVIAEEAAMPPKPAAILARSAAPPGLSPESLAELDFRFHFLVALSSGNDFYPLFANSFKPAFENLAGLFYSDLRVVSYVRRLHAGIVDAIRCRDAAGSAAMMRRLLEHGEKKIRAIMSRGRGG